MKLIPKIAAVALLFVAFDSAALTLGRLRGAAVLGQPLDVMVQIQVDGAEDVAALCFEAEVFHADIRKDPGQVRVVVERSAQTAMADVRVMSQAAIDEPIITLNLRYGCGQKISRRYVLFADLPNQGVPPPDAESVPGRVELMPAAPPSANRPSTAAGPVAVVAASVANGKAQVAPKAGARKNAERPRTRSKSAPAAKRSGVASKVKPVRAEPLSRLKLDPLDVLSDRIANLDAPMTFEPSADALLNIEKMKSLEGEMKALRDSALKNERSLADMKVRLQQAESERFPGVILYLLAASVLACLLIVAWLWNRQRQSAAGESWWSDSGASPLPAAEARRGPDVGVAPVRQHQGHSKGPGVARAKAVDAESSLGLEAHSGPMGDSHFLDFTGGNLKDRAPPGRAASAQEGGDEAPVKLVRSLNSDAIMKIRRQAKKFVSRGKPEDAVAILRKQISESEEPNPFVYLDLLGLFHSLGLQSDFQQFSQDFNLLFNGRVPEFAVYKDEGKSLESYPEALARITECWPTPKVLELIEAFVFRDPWAAKSEPFDLAALRDLLFLHRLARSSVVAGVAENGETRSDHAPTLDAAQSQPAHLDYADSVASSFPALSKSALAELFGPETEPAHGLDLDLDLSDLGSRQSTAASTPGADIDLSALMPTDHAAHAATVVDLDLPDSQTTRK